MSTVTPLPTDQLTLLAGHMITGQSTRLSAQDLAAAMVDVQLETQITGSPLLVVQLSDPDWVIGNDGLITVNEDGLLAPVDVNFPEGSSSWWRLAMVDGGDALGQPNLTLTFEDRIVSYLRDHWGPKAVKPGTRTRAQFVKQLVTEVQDNGGITFVCPSLNVLQPVAAAPRSSSVNSQSGRDRKNKGRGLHPSADVTAKSVALDDGQVHEANLLLDEAVKLKAGPVATSALMCAAIGESWIGRAPGTFQPNSAGYWGVLQAGSGQKGSAPNFLDPHDTSGMAQSFLLGGRGFQAGGAIALARTVSDPGQIATQVEASGQPPSFYGQYAGEAAAIIAAYGSLPAGSQDSTTTPVSDVGQLQRGTTDNPDEDSWGCIQRLAQEVAWYAFTNADALYYMDGPDLIGQQPALYLDRDRDDGRVQQISYTVDNTAFRYRSTHKTRGKIARRSRIAKPQTPTQVRLEVICDVLELRAGDVIVLRNYGPADGRWIVQDATRNCFTDTFTTLTLVPPTAPFPEPRASKAASGGVPVSGAATSAADAAKRALAEKSKYVYSQTRPMPSSLFGPAPRVMDCSAFVTLCYKAAGLPDPNALGYNGSGYTGTLFNNCEKIADGSDRPPATVQPGDLCFYGNLTYLHRGLSQVPTHVTIYIGAGQVISMGEQGDPSQGPPTVMKAATDSLLGFYRPKPPTVEQQRHGGAATG